MIAVSPDRIAFEAALAPVAQVSDGIGWTTARIDQDLTAKVRRDMPVLEHRKRV